MRQRARRYVAARDAVGLPNGQLGGPLGCVPGRPPPVRLAAKCRGCRGHPHPFGNSGGGTAPKDVPQICRKVWLPWLSSSKRQQTL